MEEIMTYIPPNLYRQRFIPLEIIHLKDDIILEQNPNLIVTKWKTLKPRKDIASGISAYFISDNIKVSKIFNKENQLVYWYCDIIHTRFEKESNSFYFEDLLIDIILHPDGTVEVLDIGELADAFHTHLIDETLLNIALKTSDKLLLMIRENKFKNLQTVIEHYE